MVMEEKTPSAAQTIVKTPFLDTFKSKIKVILSRQDTNFQATRSVASEFENQSEYKQEQSIDGTIRLTFKEGYITVLIPTKDEKWACCVSCQVGCPIGCKFCHTPKLKRNLTSSEIVAQIEYAKQIIGKLPTSVVFMGMGEPMMNFRSVDEAIHNINKLGISYKKITLSTSGFYLEKLLDVPYHVALSLHTPFDDMRAKLMPTTKKVADLVAFAHEYSKKRKFGLMIEYALMKGINDRDEDMRELTNIIWPKNIFFNFIEFNSKGEFTKSARLEEFKQHMMTAGYKAFIRPSRGADISAACGMLDYASQTTSQ
jgi:23S rRNA (adenine2503-C2)-methyltransferase